VTDPQTEANSAGSGAQSVNIVVGNMPIFWLALLFLGLIALMVVTNRASTAAELKANQAIKASEDMQTEYRLTQIWLQRASVSCQSSGINVPAIPAGLK
jgi:hypothetical protein